MAMLFVVCESPTQHSVEVYFCRCYIPSAAANSCYYVSGAVVPKHLHICIHAILYIMFLYISPLYDSWDTSLTSENEKGYGL